MNRIAILAALSTLTFGVACSTPPRASNGVVSDSSNSENRPQADVQINSCINGAYLPTVSVKITNHTSKRSNYTVNVNLLAADGTKVGDGVALATNIEAGQSSIEDLLATSHGSFATCRIVTVQRYAA